MTPWLLTVGGLAVVGAAGYFFHDLIMADLNELFDEIFSDLRH